MYFYLDKASKDCALQLHFKLWILVCIFHTFFVVTPSPIKGVHFALNIQLLRELGKHRVITVHVFTSYMRSVAFILLPSSWSIFWLIKKSFSDTFCCTLTFGQNQYVRLWQLFYHWSVKITVLIIRFCFQKRLKKQ